MGGVVLFYLQTPEELSWTIIQSYLSIGKMTMLIVYRMDLRLDRSNRKRQEDLYGRGYNVGEEVMRYCGGRILSKPLLLNVGGARKCSGFHFHGT